MVKSISSIQGRIVSLGGIIGRSGYGLEVERPDAAVTFNPGVLILHDNPKRKWAIIQNLDVNPVYFSFDTGTLIAPTMYIPAGGILQLDDNLPHTGVVYLSSTTGNVTWMEASVNG